MASPPGSVHWHRACQLHSEARSGTYAARRRLAFGLSARRAGLKPDRGSVDAERLEAGAGRLDQVRLRILGGDELPVDDDGGVVLAEGGERLAGAQQCLAAPGR